MNDLYDELIPSAKFGGLKPKKEVYESLLSYLEIVGENAVMIGDDDVCDVGANQVDMKTIFLGENKDSWEYGAPDYIVKDFFLIKEIIESLMNLIL